MACRFGSESWEFDSYVIIRRISTMAKPKKIVNRENAIQALAGQGPMKLDDMLKAVMKKDKELQEQKEQDGISI